jgi:hypothetical protein
MVEGTQTQITTSRAEPVVQLVMRALLALGYDTRVGEVEEILTSVKDSLTEGGPLAEALSYIWCDDYLCPGGHYSRRLDYDEEKLAEGHRCYSSGERTWVEGHLPEGVYYVGEGECAALVTVTLDSEGEPGGQQYYYPVASGPCVEALGWDSDGFYESSVLSKWEERARLRTFLEGSTTWTRVKANRAARALEADVRRDRNGG